MICFVVAVVCWNMSTCFFAHFWWQSIIKQRHSLTISQITFFLLSVVCLVVLQEGLALFKTVSLNQNSVWRMSSHFARGLGLIQNGLTEKKSTFLKNSSQIMLPLNYKTLSLFRISDSFSSRFTKFWRQTLQKFEVRKNLLNICKKITWIYLKLKVITHLKLEMISP